MQGGKKVAISDQYLAMARKRLKIDRYMLRCIWRTLNPLFIHVTFTAIWGKNVLKWWTFELTRWITGKQLKIDGHMLQCIWRALNPLSIHVTFTAIVPGAYPGEARMCLSWRSQMPPHAKRVKATTCVTTFTGCRCDNAFSTSWARWCSSAFVAWRRRT